MSNFRALWKKTAWKSHLYIFFSRGCCFGKRVSPHLELRLPRWTLQCFPQLWRYANACVVYMCVWFSRWNGWNRMFSSWDVLISIAWFFFVSLHGQLHQAWSSMRPVHFYPQLPPWHIMICYLASGLKALGTHITWFGHVYSTGVRNMVLGTNVRTFSSQCTWFDLAGLFFASLCSDWPRWWRNVIWDGWN